MGGMRGRGVWRRGMVMIRVFSHRVHACILTSGLASQHGHTFPSFDVYDSLDIIANKRLLHHQRFAASS